MDCEKCAYHLMAVSACDEAYKNIKEENARLRFAMELAISRAGIADPVQACRTVIHTLKEALKTPPSPQKE